MNDVTEVIYMALPSYNGLDPRTAQQFWERSIHPESKYASMPRIHNPKGSSALANIFNYHWCNARNLRKQGVNITRWAMLHSDVVPADWFISTLLTDLDAHGADVMSAVAPLKDIRAITSTGIDDPNDHWNVLRRITLKEIYRLPSVFTAADCGYPNNALLVNTGCFVCDFTKDWVKKTHFEIDDCIVEDEEGLAYPKYAPEDWNFSRQLHKLGAKVMATRNVLLGHVGSLDYTNNPGWGTSSWDEQHQDKFLYPIGSDEPVARGWFTHDEGKFLEELSVGKRVLEIGSYCGRSSIYIARSAERLHCLDTFKSTAVGLPEEDTYKEFLFNITRYGLIGKVTDTRANSQDCPQLNQKFDMVFIDGDHSYEAVKSDIDYAVTNMNFQSGGILAFHDYHSQKDPGVTKAVDELLARGVSVIKQVGSLIAISI